MSSGPEQTPLQTVEEFYRRIDAADLDGAGELLADEVAIRFGDRPPLSGREAIVTQLTGFGEMIEWWTHDFVHVHVVPGPDDATTVIAESYVVYKMLHSGNEIGHHSVSVTVVSVAGEIVEQRNTGDLRPVLDDHQAHAPA